ncbi:MAG: hypothetical protein SVS85_04120, partial [Candidatus Nanohaloarchaea archaeon]|nr:hypothetical protein [Candidatus Nanohaloarchaea archaeon]
LEDEGTSEEDNQRWAGKLERVTGADAVISQNEVVKRLVEEYTGMELVEQELYDPERFSATEVRRRMREGGNWEELIPECAVEKVEEFSQIFQETQEA